MKKIVFLCLFAYFLFALKYTSEEKRFLKSHPVIYFSAMEYWPVDENGNSIHTNFIGLLNRYGNLNIQPIYFKYWSEGFNAAKEGKTYGIAALSRSKKREKYFYYTPPYNYNPYYLIVKKGSDIHSFKDLKNKRVFVAKNSIIRELLKNKKIFLTYTKNPYKDLMRGKIDAVLTFYMPKTGFVKNLKVTKVFIDTSGEEHIGICKKYPVLYSVVLKAFKAIPYDEIEKIKEKYYFNPMPPVNVITPETTLKDLINPADVVLLFSTILFLFVIVYLFITRKYLNLKLKKFLMGIFTIEAFILAMIVYEIVMLNYYSNKILQVKSRSFNELFLTDKISESVFELNDAFIRKIKNRQTSYYALFAGKRNADGLKVLDKTLSYYLSPEFFHPSVLSKIAKIKIILNNLITLQDKVMKNLADISIYDSSFGYIMDQIKLIRNYIKNENDKEISLIKDKIKYQFLLFMAIALIFVLSNILLFIMIKKKIYKPITYLITTIQKHKKGISAGREYFYNDEMGILIKEFFSLQKQLGETIKALKEHKKNLEKEVKEEVRKRTCQEEVLLKQSRLALMGEMIDAIAHQWKQPLSLINLYLYRLKKEKNGNIEEISNDIKAQITHMVNTLNEFRNFFKDDKQKELICISTVVNNTMLLLKDDLIKNGIKVYISLEPDFCIMGISNEFKHLLITIIINAKDVFNEKNIKDRKIKISTREDENFYYLGIEDNAGGVPENIKDKIFDLNFSTKKEGSGVGLYLANRIAVKHTGVLNVTNTRNGAKFVFKIRKKG
ncbi:ATP-binding protein [Nautilia sp.]